MGREAFTHAALLLAGTRRIAVATGIANIWARDAMAMAAAPEDARRGVSRIASCSASA